MLSFEQAASIAKKKGMILGEVKISDTEMGYALFDKAGTSLMYYNKFSVLNLREDEWRAECNIIGNV